MNKAHARWSFVVVPTVAALTVVWFVGVAHASHVPVTTTCASTGVLADGTTVNTINANVDPTKLRTKGPVEVLHICNLGAPGFSSHWHYHAGPVIVNVLGGALTFYGQNQCSGTTVTAGQAYLETPGEPVLALNASTTDTATWVTTQIIPVNAPTSVPVSPGFCDLT